MRESIAFDNLFMIKFWPNDWSILIRVDISRMTWAVEVTRNGLAADDSDHTVEQPVSCCVSKSLLIAIELPL